MSEARCHPTCGCAHHGPPDYWDACCQVALLAPPDRVAHEDMRHYEFAAWLRWMGRLSDGAPSQEQGTGNREQGPSTIPYSLFPTGPPPTPDGYA